MMCSEPSVIAANDARSLGTKATIVGGVGLAAIAAGVVLYVLAPRSETTTIAVHPSVTPGSAGLTLVGTF